MSNVTNINSKREHYGYNKYKILQQQNPAEDETLPNNFTLD